VRLTLSRKRVAAVVTVTEGQGKDVVDAEARVRTLQELYDACRKSAPGRLVRVSIAGPEGEVRLNFASYRRKSG
jgi:hypothetical protein